MKSKQTKPLYLVFASLTIAMLALSLLAPLCLGSKQKWKWYESKEGEYKVKYPADWNIQVQGGESLLVFDALNIGYDPGLSLHVSCSPAHYNESLYELEIKSIEWAKKKNFPDFICSEITNITLNGYPAIKAVATFTDARHSPPSHVKEISIMCAREGKHYVIHFMVETYDAKKTERYFDKYPPLANEMIDSFKFI
jgi:hypothetical protein